MSAKAIAEAQPASPAAARSFTPARAPLLQRRCACDTAAPGGECDTCRPPSLQRRASGPDVGSLPPIVDQVLRSPGQPLDSGTRTFMESRLGHDFGHVRLHTDSHAAESARAVNAHAYTVGQDVAFAAGKYDPGSSSGRHLLAHELTHTVQQRGLQRSSDAQVDAGAEYQRLEREADAAADAVVTGEAVTIDRRAAQPTLSRADAGTVTKAKSKKPGRAQSVLGQHTVTPTEVFTIGSSSLEEFVVDPFYLPAIKGPAAVEMYRDMAGQGLEATLALSGAKTKTALWQTRPSTDVRRDLWFQRVGWTAEAADDLWVRAGGTKPFPNVGKTVCQMDHIVELQVGGTNPPENIQPLDPDRNRESGGTIKRQLETLAVDIAKDPGLSSGDPTQVKLRFASVKLSGSVPQPTTCPPPKGRATCLAVEACAKKLKVEKTKAGKVTIAHEDYPISAGGRPSTMVKVPTTFAGRSSEVVAIEADPVNAGASTLIPGLLLTTLAHQKAKAKKPDVIQARIDDRDKTRLPISLPPDSKPVRLNVAADGDLSLDPADKKGGIAFTYKYLSKGRITAISVDQAGELAWKGTITPSVKFLGPLAVQYAQGVLSVTKGLEEAELKKRSVLGMRVTKAEVALQLAPGFKPTGTIELRLGSEESPLATARLELGADDVGLIATGKINARIPKMESATADITYKGGGARDEWRTDLVIKSDDIKLGSAVSVGGQLAATLAKDTIDFGGTINATFPNDSRAELGLRHRKRDGFILDGTGTFHAPNVKNARVHVTYYLAQDRLVATGDAHFTLDAIKLSGELTQVTFTIAKGGPAKVYGTGKLTFSRGRASGHLDVQRHENGKFSGKGSLTYKLSDTLTVNGTVGLDEREKLHIAGGLLIARYELFPVHADKKDLVSVDVPVPVPALSIGTTGVVFHIKGNVGVGYSFGPGTIEPLKFSADFDPLEADPNVKFAVSGIAKVPASALLLASISGSLALQADVGVGSAGAEGGVKLQGDLLLQGGAFAKLDAAYERQRLTAQVVAGIETKLLLGVSLTAFVRAWAGAFGVEGQRRQDWTLAKKTIDTQLGFYLSAPFSYANDTGIKLPEAKDITLTKPEITKDNLKRILNELFGQTSPKQVES